MTEVEERVRHYYPTVDSGDAEAVAALFAEDAVYARPGYQPLRGRAAILAFYTGDRVIAEGRHTVDRVLVAGGRAAVQGRFDGVLKDGSEVAVEFADFFDVDDAGAFTERTTYFYAPLV